MNVFITFGAMKKFILLLSVLFLFSCTKETIKFTLTTSSNPVEAGTVSPDTRQYNEGDTANLTAIAAAEYEFKNWTGAMGGSETTVVMNSDKTVVANFVKKKYALTTAVEGEGTITEKIIKAGAATDYNSGTVVELTATPSAEWVFKEWTGDLTGTENPKQITIDKAKTVKAVFVKKQYALTVEIEGEGTVAEKIIKAGAATDYNSGTVVELTATPSAGWGFKQWNGDLTGTENPKEISIDKPKTVSAVFETLIPFYLDENGVTIKAYDWVTAGTKGELGGVTYTAVDKDKLKEMLKNSETDVTKIVTTTIKDDFLISDLFRKAMNEERFGANISTWDMSNVNSLDSMFLGVSKDNGINGKSINIDISNWDVSNVTNFNNFLGIYCTIIKVGDLSNWDVSKATNMAGMFAPTRIDGADEKKWIFGDLSNWDVSKVESMSGMFGNLLMDFDITKWNVSKVTKMSSLFRGNTTFNQDISGWDVSKVTDMSAMFSEASSFNQNIGSWNTANVTNMEKMFWYATSFNQDISNWNTANVTNMFNLFDMAIAFNQNIQSWDVSNVTTMRSLFNGASSFNQDISSWNTATVTNMSTMFNGATVFNQDISDWDVSNVTSMYGMFAGATAFNQDLNSWDTSSVVNMQYMFSEASSFNGNILNWNTSKVTAVNYMFKGASSFNQNIGSWDVGAVTEPSLMREMFNGATIFNQDLTKWCVTNVSYEPVNFNKDSALTEANKPVWGTCPGNSYTIAVNASSSSNYTLTGKDRNGDVSGNDPGLTFNVGDEVTFSVNAANHPFYLKTVAGTGTGNQISGVTNNGATSGSVVWTPTAAGTYYYQCSSHSGMVGTITIED